MTFDLDIWYSDSLLPYLDPSVNVKVIDQSLRSQDETATATIASAVGTVNVYNAGGLWRMKLNYDGNVALTVHAGITKKYCAKVTSFLLFRPIN